MNYEQRVCRWSSLCLLVLLVCVYFIWRAASIQNAGFDNPPLATTSTRSTVPRTNHSSKIQNTVSYRSSSSSKSRRPRWIEYRLPNIRFQKYEDSLIYRIGYEKIQTQWSYR